MSFTFADLFAGIGGFHSALARHGGRCTFVSEIDESASDIYRKNWKSSAFNSDIREVTEGNSILVPRHDVLTAGFPCQPFSKSGHQRGVNEARGTLFYNIMKIVESRKPQLILLENVKNLLGPKHISDYRKMVQMLRRGGYAISETPSIMSPHLLPIEYGGTPQNRERVFMGAFYVGKSKSNILKTLPPLFYKNPFLIDPNTHWNIKDYLMKNSEIPSRELEVLRLSGARSEALQAWDKFITIYRKKTGGQLPGFPLWTDYWRKPQSSASYFELPDWKQSFIRRNIEFYNENSDWIDSWMQRTSLRDMIPSYRKFEWQAKEFSSLYKCLIQFRPSGIRIKTPNYIPTFVAMSQTPVVGWLNRELAINEAKVLQGFDLDFDFAGQSSAATLRQIGNSVHPGVASFVFSELVRQARQYDQKWASETKFKRI